MTPDQRQHIDEARAALDQAEIAHREAKTAVVDAIYDADAPSPDFHALAEALQRARHTLDCCRLALRIAESRLSTNAEVG